LFIIEATDVYNMKVFYPQGDQNGHFCQLDYIWIHSDLF
jgi:hypothetical protein